MDIQNRDTDGEWGDYKSGDIYKMRIYTKRKYKIYVKKKHMRSENIYRKQKHINTYEK